MRKIKAPHRPAESFYLFGKTAAEILALLQVIVSGAPDDFQRFLDVPFGRLDDSLQVLERVEPLGISPVLAEPRISTCGASLRKTWSRPVWSGPMWLTIR